MCGWTGWGGMMGFGMLLFWLLPIGLIAALLFFLNDRNRKSQPPQRAIDILENAYARGEITREEFLAKRADLLGKPDTPPS